MSKTKIRLFTIMLAMTMMASTSEIIDAEQVLQTADPVIETEEPEETESHLVVYHVEGTENEYAEMMTESEENALETAENEEPEKIEETVQETWETYTLTAYCGCEKCCGQWHTDGTVIGSGGVELIQGKHCASPLPNGTKVLIEGLGEYEVQDSTADWIASKYNGKIIDIYFEDHEDALRFGKRTAKVKVEE